MTEFGRYDPTSPQHSSSLFSYGEVPLASLKLNLWNGNVQAALDFLVEAAVTLFGGWSSDYLLPGLSTQPLQVVAQAIPNLSVTVSPGRCIVAKYFAGLDAAETVPETGSFAPPAQDDRIDLVVIDRGGNLLVVAGIESPVPVPPAPPANTLKLAEIYLRPGATSIKDEDDTVNGYIVDARPAVLSGRAHRHGTDHQPSESPDGSRLNFSTVAVYVAGTLQVFQNGVLQRAGAAADYTEDADRHGYTFTSAPHTGDVLRHFYHDVE